MHYINISKHRCMYYLSMKKDWNQCIVWYIPYVFFKMKITIKTRIQITLKDSKEQQYYIQSILGFFNYINMTSF
jgi:hypothetical protein